MNEVAAPAQQPTKLHLEDVSEAALRKEVKRRYDAGDLDNNEWIEGLFDGADTEFVESEHHYEEARHRLQRGEFKEALYQLSIALGQDFGRLADITPENLR